MRRGLALLLSFQLASAPLAWAEPDGGALRKPEPADTARFFKSVSRSMTRTSAKVLALKPRSKAELLEKIKSGGARLAESPVAHTAQTSMLLWILGGIEAIRQQEHLRPINPSADIRQTDGLLDRMAQWWGLSLGVGHHMVNSLELVSSMAGASATATAMSPALKALNGLVANSVTRPMLAKLMMGGSASFVTFVGWEAGHRIWEEATFLLDEKDIPIAKELKFYELMTGGGTVEQKQVFGRVLLNAMKILMFAQPDVTRSWIYNTWRLNIATGEFVTMLTSMVTFGVAAGSIAPGAGHLVGLLFGFAGGLVGGLVAIFIPQPYKQSITDGIRRGRAALALRNLERNARVIQDDFSKLNQPGQYDSVRTFLKLQGEQFFSKYRRDLREDLGTVYIEQIFDAYSRLQEADFVLGVIKAGQAERVSVNGETPRPVRDLEREFQAQRSDATSRIQYYFNRLLDVQKNEAKVLGPMAYDLSAAGNLLEPALTKALRDQESVHMALRHIYVGLFPDKQMEMGLTTLTEADLKLLPANALILLTVFSMRGFDESMLLDE